MELRPKRKFEHLSPTNASVKKYDRLCAYLKKFPVEGSTLSEYQWVQKQKIQFVAAAAGIPCRKEDVVWGLLDTTANIGMRWNKEIKDVEYRYYEPQEGDDLMQRAIDEF